MRAFILNCSPVRTGATAALCALAAEALAPRASVRSACIDDYPFAFCRGCRSCHATGRCALPEDGVSRLMADLDRADVLLFVAPSYWADVPGQFKAFIDRCTPWSNTHDPHAALAPGKRAYALVLRTGPGLPECERLIATLTHYLGHLDVPCRGTLALTRVEGPDDVPARREEVLSFCASIE